MKSSFGEQLRQARRSAKVSTQQLARKLGVSQPAISYAETGKKLLSEEKILKAAEVLYVNAADLLQVAANERQRIVFELEGHDPEFVSLLCKLRAVKPGERIPEAA